MFGLRFDVKLSRQSTNVGAIEEKKTIQFREKYVTIRLNLDNVIIFRGQKIFSSVTARDILFWRQVLCVNSEISSVHGAVMSVVQFNTLMQRCQSVFIIFVFRITFKITKHIIITLLFSQLQTVYPI